jgi:hypothetical protein
MTTYTIDTDNNITAFRTKAEAAAAVPSANLTVVASTEEEFTAAIDECGPTPAGWPVSHLVELWNSFAGVPPFGDLKPVKKFTDRKTAIARIWKAIQALTPTSAPQAAPVTPKKAKAPKDATAKDAAPTTREGSKKAIVIEMLKRPEGATLSDIMSATSWQCHSVRGFISGCLGKKMGLKIESAKREDGQRCYKLSQ